LTPTQDRKNSGSNCQDQDAAERLITLHAQSLGAKNQAPAVSAAQVQPLRKTTNSTTIRSFVLGKNALFLKTTDIQARVRCVFSDSDSFGVRMLGKAA